MVDQKDTSPQTLTVAIALILIIAGIGYIIMKLGF